MSTLERNRKGVVGYRHRMGSKINDSSSPRNGEEDPRVMYPLHDGIMSSRRPYEEINRYPQRRGSSGVPEDIQWNYSSNNGLRDIIDNSPKSQKRSTNPYSPRSPRIPSPMKEIIAKSPRIQRRPSNDYSHRSSIVTTPNSICEVPSPRPAARYSRFSENEYTRKYSTPNTVRVPKLQPNSGFSSRKDSSIDEKDVYRSRSAAPYLDAAQRKSSYISDIYEEVQPVPPRRNSNAYKDTSSPRVLTPRKSSMPLQNGLPKGVNSNDSVNVTNLSRDDNFFEKVMAFERNKEMENSPNNGSNGNIRYGQNIKLPPPRNREPNTNGHKPNPQNSVQNSGTESSKWAKDIVDFEIIRPNVYNDSLQPPKNTSMFSSSQTRPNLKSPNNNDSESDDLVNRLSNIDKIIIPSKNARNDEKLPPNGFTPKALLNSDQKFNGRKSKSPDGFLDYNVGAHNKNCHGISPLYVEFEGPLDGHNRSAPIVSSKRQTAPKLLQKIVVIDVGHYYIRAGILRDQPTEPDLCIPNSIAVTSKGLLFGEDILQIADPEADRELGTTSVISPLRQSQIVKPVLVNGAPIQKIFFQNIIKRLSLTGNDYKLLLCLPTRASALRPYFLDYFIGPNSKAEKEGLDCFEAAATISAFRAALQTAKIATCLIISLNADLEIIPIAEGRLLEQGRSTTALYGEMALRYFLEELVEAGVDLTEKEIDCYGPYIYQKVAFIENKNSVCEDIAVDLAQYAPYPLNKQINVPAELRRKASDALLRSEDSIGHDGELPSFKQLLKAAIQSCDLDLRSSICSNVLIIGEFAQIEGFRERVQDEIRLIITGSRANVQIAPIPAECVYEGACLLTTLLQGTRAPKCPWFRFLDDFDWSNMCQEANSTSGISDTRLLSRLNRDCVWP